jgi:hypothetical protein
MSALKACSFKEWNAIITPRPASPQMQQRCADCVAKNMPAEIDFHICPSLTGQIFASGFMRGPDPTSPTARLVVLHECAHWVLEHLKHQAQKPNYLKEFEAERWAQRRLRRCRISIPFRDAFWQRVRICSLVGQALLSGDFRIDPQAMQFVGLTWTVIRRFIERRNRGSNQSLAETLFPSARHCRRRHPCLL